jgi:dolichol-phosphate mannosyltransferase
MIEPNQLLLSVCIPAYNEEGNIGRTIDSISSVLEKADIPYEFVIANDNSRDKTSDVIRERMKSGIPIRLVHRTPPGGFGRAMRSCFNHFCGDVVVIVMADLSDEPNDIVTYYRMIEEGYDAVFGSRFLRGSKVTDYPKVKLVANRIGNHFIRILFRTRHNDLTNAFKMYRADVIRSLAPFYGAHFNLLIEVSLGALIRDYKIGYCPINWYGRTWGQANFKIRELGRRYFATLTRLYAEKIFIHDDVLAEHDKKVMHLTSAPGTLEKLETNIGNKEDIDNWRSRIRRVEPFA